MVELPNVPRRRGPGRWQGGQRRRQDLGRAPEISGDKGRDHVELCRRLGLVDYERGTKLGGAASGSTGLGAALEWALLDYFIRRTSPTATSSCCRRTCCSTRSATPPGSSPSSTTTCFHLPTLMTSGARFLLPTAETAILNVYRTRSCRRGAAAQGVCLHPCYRREAGGYRTDERGTVRGHQFNKVEIFQFAAGGRRTRRCEEMVGQPSGSSRSWACTTGVAARRQGRQRLDEDHLRHRGVDSEHRGVQGGVLGVLGRGLPGSTGRHPVPAGGGEEDPVRPHVEWVRPGDQPPVAGDR